MEEKIVTVPVLTSPFLEEIHAAFDSISRLESLFLSQDCPDVSSLHHSVKHLYSQILQYGGNPNLNEIESRVRSTPHPNAPASLMSFYTCDDPQAQSNTTSTDKIVHHRTVSASDPTVQLLKYPQIHSVQFSYIDTKDQLENLAQLILTGSEDAIGLYVIEHLVPETVCGLCISTRECEYLIDMSELPNAIECISPIFASPKVVKVVYNCQHCCRLLHKMGATDIYNVFEITAASQFLGLESSLEELTLEFRRRLNEGWIKDSITKGTTNEALPEVCDAQVLSKILTDAEASPEQDWRIHPLSLAQMKIARQRVHYLLYLYDSLRLKLSDEEDSRSLDNAVTVSHHKAEMDWSSYNFMIQSPNAEILARLYDQPLPNPALISSLMEIRKQEVKNSVPQFALSDASLLWTSLMAPKNAAALEAALNEALPVRKSFFVNDVPEMPKSFANAIIAAIEKNPTEPHEQKTPKQRTLEEIITDMGWLPTDEQFDAPKKHETPILLETTVSPRVVKNASQKALTAPAGGYLKHLRDPDQPTSVSKQIEGIPKTEAQIFALANNVRLLQKMSGKTKTKLTSAKEDAVVDESPEDVLKSLVSMGYIDESEANAVKVKINTPKPVKPNQKRGRSKDSKPPPSQNRGNQQPSRRGRI